MIVKLPMKSKAKFLMLMAQMIIMEVIFTIFLFHFYFVLMVSPFSQKYQNRQYSIYQWRL